MTRDLGIFYSAVLLSNISFDMTDWFFPLLANQVGGVALVGQAFLLSSIIGLIAVQIGGWIADGYGRKIALILSSVFSTLSVVVLAFARFLNGFGALVILLNLSLLSLTSLGMSARRAYPAEATAKTGRIGLTSSIFRFILALSQVMFNLLFLLLGLDMLILYLIAMGVVSVLLVFSLKETLAVREVQSLSTRMRRLVPNLKLFHQRRILQFFVLTGPLSYVSLLLPVYLFEAAKIQKSIIAEVYAVIPLPLLLMYPLGGIATDKFGWGKIIASSSFLYGAMLLLIGLPSGQWVTLAIFAGIVISSEIMLLGGQIYIVRITSPQERGATFAAYFAFQGLLAISAPLVGTTLYAIAPTFPFLVAGLTFTLFGLAILKLSRRSAICG